MEALLALLDEGDLKPTSERIAARAGVSERTLFQHFPDREALFQGAALAQADRIAPMIEPLPGPSAPVEERVGAFAAQRARLLERVSPVRRAALQLEPSSETVAGWLRAVREGAAAEVCKDARQMAPPTSSTHLRRRPAEEREPLIVREPLERFLDENGLGSGRVEAERIGEGHSNITYLIERGDERFVLRRPPRGPLPPSAHDVLREARLLGAIETADVRTPRVLAACDDESVIGAPFYVMAYEEGVVITSEVPRTWTRPSSGAGSARS